MEVTLRKLGAGGRTIRGRLVRRLRLGAPLVVEFAEGTHEYITTPVCRILREVPRDPKLQVFFVSTQNSRYRLELSREAAEAVGPTDAASGDAGPGGKV